MSKQERKSAAKAIAETAQQIWLAGLGAFAKAQAEGSRTFEQLIREGSALEKQTRKYTKDSLQELRSTMEDTTARLRKRGEASVEHLQRVIDQRIDESLARLAVPSEADFARLADQVGRLNRQLAGLPAEDDAAGPSADDATPSGDTHRGKSGKPKAKAKSAATKSAAKKSVANKPAATKKAAARKPGKAT